MNYIRCELENWRDLLLSVKNKAIELLSTGVETSVNKYIFDASEYLSISDKEKANEVALLNCTCLLIDVKTGEFRVVDVYKRVENTYKFYSYLSGGVKVLDDEYSSVSGYVIVPCFAVYMTVAVLISSMVAKEMRVISNGVSKLCRYVEKPRLEDVFDMCTLVLNLRTIDNNWLGINLLGIDYIGCVENARDK